MEVKYYSRKKIKAKLNPHFIKVVVCDNTVKVYTLPARELLFHPLRFDIMIKYLYVKYRERGVDIPFIRDLYALHVRQPDGRYFEADGRKHSLKCYINSFHEIIDSIHEYGFDPELSIVPINSDRQVLDGSHRVAASAYFGGDITVAEFDHAHDFSYKTFCDQKKIPQELLDFVALHYCILNENSYIVNLRPIADGKESVVEKILERYGHIYYKKEINFTLTGSILCEHLFYKSEKWIGSPEDNFSGARARVDRFYNEKRPMRVYALECPTLDQAKEAKQCLRDIYKRGNDPVHITDTREETIELASLYFNENSLHLFNNQKKYPDRNFLRLFQSFRHWLYDHDVDPEDVIIDGSSVMSVYGLRQSCDIDYLAHEARVMKLESELFDQHDPELKHHSFSKQELIYDPRLHLYFDNIKFVSLSALKKMKERRGEIPKDVDDIKLISSVLLDRSFSFVSTSLKIHLRYLPRFFKTKVRKAVNALAPNDTLRRKILKKVNSCRSRTIELLCCPKIIYYRLLPGYIHHVDYYGYSLFFSNKTSIVERYLATGSYEPDVVSTLFSVLDSTNGQKRILDIGANIGMISLALARRYPDAQLYAFEPGPHQAELFRRTIEKNGLESRIQLNQTALSDTCSEASFAVHSGEHASGDGLLDTGRCGECQYITIKTETLDYWWGKNGKPRIDIVKIDVEGAELLVMRGGKDFFFRMRPPIVFEIHPENLRPYPYSAFDIIEFLEKCGYEVLNLDRSALGGNQRMHLLNGNYAGEFLAVPKKLRE